MRVPPLVPQPLFSSTRHNTRRVIWTRIKLKKKKLKHNPHTFSNTKHCRRNHKNYPRCQPVFPISVFFFNFKCKRYWKDIKVIKLHLLVESSWNVMAHGDAREGKWRGTRRMEWVASTLHTTSEHGVSGVTTADPHTSAASSRLNWRPRRFKWTRPFRRMTKSGFCACAITFRTQSKTV